VSDYGYPDSRNDARDGSRAGSLMTGPASSNADLAGVNEYPLCLYSCTTQFTACTHCETNYKVNEDIS